MLRVRVRLWRRAKNLTKAAMPVTQSDGARGAGFQSQQRIHAGALRGSFALLLCRVRLAKLDSSAALSGEGDFGEVPPWAGDQEYRGVRRSREGGAA